MKLLLGNNIDELKKLPDDSVHCIITSPPYYNAKLYSQYASYEDYLAYLTEVFSLAFAKLKENRMCCVNVSVVLQAREKRSKASKRIPIPFHLVTLMERIGYEFLDDLIWLKPEGAAYNRNGGFYQNRLPVAYKPNCVNEYILVFKKPSKRLIDDVLKRYPQDIREASRVQGDYERTNVWYINPETTGLHPAPFPLALPLNLIRYYTFEGDTVMDIFMGSGTTGVACRQLNRHFIGMEINKDFYDTACRRISNCKRKGGGGNGE